VGGIPTTRELAIQILRSEQFASGHYSTSFLEESGQWLVAVAAE
jgi:biotin carboxylase